MTDRTPAVGDTITTPEELDALPVRSVVLSQDQIGDESTGPYSLAHQLMHNRRWYTVDASCKHEGTHPDYVLPAIVLHIPGRDPHADRDRARSIAVHLEQEVAHLAAEHARALRAANIYGSVLEQVGLLQEHYAELGAAIPAVTLQAVLDGGLLEDVRNA